MRIDLKTLKHLPVETVSGTSLGHIYDFELEVEAQLIAQYRVRSSLLRQTAYLVSRGQVVAITDTKMIVDDAVAKAPAKIVPEKSPPGVEPVPMRKTF
ncbi:MAG: hypothetical protein UY92_C0017G0011 [Candidatus Magasanikbacteria bacterium GW2011_GWA2_56_11]|uniref:PRC-barrel domain-containing protein n=1 Tax=Candidatus Magasanikbacteria bacterium GW2011_GWA2_56_11 TaxID=1619044 RepID=A0A0G1YDC2_9BACT|nr:MAG: hypothetical protein UY92_C0017G0011 [Candidatus Magasanikbacteria bacterium GW2011_GWA2_56_11]